MPNPSFYDPRNPDRSSKLPYKYEEGEMYDPFRMGKLFGQGGIPRKAQDISAAELGKEFSWLYGGRPLTRQEVEPLLAKASGHDPRFGTIGAMPGIGQGPHAVRSGAVPYQAPKGFGPQVTTPEGGEAPMFPYQEVGPTPAAMKDVRALAQLPYDLMDQYRRIADQGIYGIAGINTIIQTGIRPAQERYKKLIPETLTTIRQHEGFVMQQASRALAKSLGGRFASQPGLAAKLIGDQVIAPSLARQAEATMDLKTITTNQLAALDMAVGDLMKENMSSKAMGLAGVQDVMGFLQQRVADRWWDLTMENKFGWSPERTAAARFTAEERLQEMAQKYGLTMARLEARLRDWINERQYYREEYGSATIPPEGSSEDGIPGNYPPYSYWRRRGWGAKEEEDEGGG